MGQNENVFTRGVIEYAFWAVKSGAYPYGTTGTIANGSDEAMARHKGASAFTVSIPASPSEAIVGDGRLYGSLRGRPIDSVTGTADFIFYDQIFDTAVRQASVYADGVYDAVMGSVECINYNTLCMILNLRDQTDTGADQYTVIEIYDMELDPDFGSFSGQSFAPVAQNYRFTLDHVTSELSGIAVSNANYGVSSAMYKVYDSVYPVTMHTHIGDGADTDATLAYTPSATDGDAVQAWTNGSALTYTTDFTVSGTTFTFQAGATPSAGETTIIKYSFLPTC